MSETTYYEAITSVITRIHSTQGDRIREAGDLVARVIAGGGRAYLFGSGHSVLPVMDVFPRYGSFVGFFPLYDPRLMWSNVIGPHGARELLWIERREGYIAQFLQSYPIAARDCLIVFSHGGLNAAPIEAALYARERGARVISVSSHQNAAAAARAHSSGKALSEVADIAIDNCVSPEDAQVDVGRREKIAAGSTIAAVFVAMALVADTGARLAASGHELTTFVSPNVEGVARDHNLRVFDEYARRWYERPPEPVVR
ncbi:MAG TPA: sugar isomerase domain-containing protein [Vicinamibacterales bacterium]|nr:sugar isomerase domain-containing protein [Vicinamibacterales bacterium]